MAFTADGNGILRYAGSISGTSDAAVAIDANAGVISAALTAIQASATNAARTTNLANVALSGSYPDLINKPSIPAASGTNAVNAINLGDAPASAYAAASALASANAAINDLQTAIAAANDAITALNGITGSLNSASTDPNISSDGSGTQTVYDLILVSLGDISASSALSASFGSYEIMMSSPTGLQDSGISTSALDGVIGAISSLNTVATDSNLSTDGGGTITGTGYYTPDGFGFGGGGTFGQFYIYDIEFGSFYGATFSELLGGMIGAPTGNIGYWNDPGFTDSGIGVSQLLTTVGATFGVFNAFPIGQWTFAAAPTNDFETEMLALMRGFGFSL